MGVRQERKESYLELRLRSMHGYSGHVTRAAGGGAGHDSRRNEPANRIGHKHHKSVQIAGVRGRRAHGASICVHDELLSGELPHRPQRAETRRAASSVPASDGAGPSEVAREICTEDEKDALKREKERRERFRFPAVGISPGSTLRFLRDETITASVINDTQIEFEGSITSLTNAARTILNRMGFQWSAVQGPNFWLFGDETLTEIRMRLESGE